MTYDYATYIAVAAAPALQVFKYTFPPHRNIIYLYIPIRPKPAVRHMIHGRRFRTSLDVYTIMTIIRRGSPDLKIWWR